MHLKNLQTGHSAAQSNQRAFAPTQPHFPPGAQAYKTDSEMDQQKKEIMLHHLLTCAVATYEGLGTYTTWGYYFYALLG